MKKIFISLFSMLCFLNTIGQITLSQSSFSSAPVFGADTLLESKGTTVFPNLFPASNGSWDMLNVTSADSVSVHYRVASNTSAQFADSGMYEFLVFPYPAKIQSSITPTGYIQSGVHIDRNAYTLNGVILASTTDSLVINDQDIIYSSDRVKIKFPATYKSVWTSTYHYDFSFSLTLSALNYNNAPGIVRAYFLEQDSVIGYGKMKVKDLNGDTVDRDVLQIQSVVYAQDSFFINNVPASSFVLSGFGLQQGQINTNSDQYFYRSGGLTPLTHVVFADNFAYPISAETDTKDLLYTYIPSLSTTQAVYIYPNPLIKSEASFLNIAIPSHSHFNLLNYEILNSAGQMVQSSSETINNRAVLAIKIDNRFATGNYFLNLNFDNKVKNTYKICIQ